MINKTLLWIIILLILLIMMNEFLNIYFVRFVKIFFKNQLDFLVVIRYVSRVRKTVKNVKFVKKKLIL